MLTIINLLHHILHVRDRRSLVLLLSFGLSTMLFSQMVPDAPIRYFSLPMFGEDGYKSWELKGIEGIYVNSNETVVKGLELSIYAGGEDLFIENQIRSPLATILLNESRAKGDSSFFFVGSNFEIQGRNWTWNGKEELITVESNARVTFSETIDILK